MMSLIMNMLNPQTIVQNRGDHMSKVHETILMLIERFPEIITLSSKRDVVENKPDEYLLTIMRSNVSLSSELVFANASQSTSIVLTLMIEKLYDFYMKGKDVSVICEMIQEQLKRGD